VEPEPEKSPRCPASGRSEANDGLHPLHHIRENKKTGLTLQPAERPRRCAVMFNPRRRAYVRCPCSGQYLSGFTGFLRLIEKLSFQCLVFGKVAFKRHRGKNRRRHSHRGSHHQHYNDLVLGRYHRLDAAQHLPHHYPRKVD